MTALSPQLERRLADLGLVRLVAAMIPPEHAREAASLLCRHHAASGYARAVYRQDVTTLVARTFRRANHD